MQPMSPDAWHLSRGGRTYGPYTWEQIVEHARDGRIGRGDQLFDPRSGAWAKPSTVPGLFGPGGVAAAPAGVSKVTLAFAGLFVAVAAGGAWLVVSPSSPLNSDDAAVASVPSLGTVTPADESGDDPLALDVLGEASPEPPVTGSFDLGEPLAIVSGTVGTDGGTIESSDGFLIDVPPGAHSEATGYTVSKQEIVGHDFGPGMNPISALYRVDNGGVLADHPIGVEVPAAVPEGGFAMGFFYDAVTGELEAMPLIAVGEGSVVVATTHFSDFFIHGVDATSLAALLAAQAAETTMSTDAPAMITDTRFRPGVDDWPFNNYGSAVSPGGHCAGQSLSAMWYFVERTRTGAPALNNRYDNDGFGLTERWQDDRNAYRMASVVQVYYRSRVDDWILEFQGLLDRWRLNLGSGGDGAALAIDSWQYAAFITAMKVTGEPQYVSIGRLDANGKRRGHAMIVYGADTRGLWIADPNYAGRFRRIPWDVTTLTLGPYYSGDDASSLGRQYDSIRLLAKTSLVDWNGVGLRFEELAFGVAGDDLFPSYTLQIYEEQPGGTGDWIDLDDGYVTLEDLVRIRLERSPSWGGASWRLTECQGTGRDACRPLHGYASTQYYDTPIEVALDPGDNSLDLYAEGYFDNGWEYVDFTRVTVHRGMAMDVSASPPTQEVEQGASAAFTIEVTNLGAAELLEVTVAVIPPEGNGLCVATIPSLPGVSTHTYDCTVTPPDEPGAYQYEIEATGISENGLSVERIVSTQITVGELVPGEFTFRCSFQWQSQADGDAPHHQRAGPCYLRIFTNEYGTQSQFIFGETLRDGWPGDLVSHTGSHYVFRNDNSFVEIVEIVVNISESGMSGTATNLTEIGSFVEGSFTGEPISLEQYWAEVPD